VKGGQDLDDYTVRIITDKPYPWALETLATIRCSAEWSREKGVEHIATMPTGRVPTA